MLRPFIRLRRIDWLLHSKQIYRNCSNSLFHEDAINRRKELNRLKELMNDETRKPVKSSSKSSEMLSQRISRIDKEKQTESIEIEQELDDERTTKLIDFSEMEDVSEILKKIESRIDHLTPDEIFSICHRLNYLLIRSKRFRIGDPTERPFQRNIDIIHSSPVFTSFLDRSIDILDQLDIYCLLQLINMFGLTYLRADDEAVVALLKNVKSRLNNLQINDLLNLFKFLNSYVKHIKGNDLIYDLMELSFERIRNKFRLKGLNSEDVDVMVKGFSLFLSLGGEDKHVLSMISYLNDLLLSTKNEFDLRQSVQLLRSIFLAHRQYDNEIDFSQFKELIQKCNIKICEILENAPFTKNVLYYANNLHSSRVQAGFNIEDFYEPKILELIAPVIIEESYLQTNAKHLILTLNYNFSRQRIFNERLLLYLFDLTSRNHMFRMQISVRAIFELFASYRLPFVDYQEIANLVEEKFDQLEKVSDTKTTGLITLSGLILNDVLIKEGLFDMFDKVITKQLSDRDSVKQFKTHQINQIVNSAVYLKLFGQANDHQIERQLQRMEQWIFKISAHNQSRNLQFQSNISDKALERTYLSNGVFVGTILVYDKSTGHLISLDSYRKYTRKIEQLPLSKDQQIVAFTRSFRLKGDISRQYENTYNYGLSRILNYYNIETIQVFHDEITRPEKVHLIQYLIKKTIDTFKVSC